MSYRPATAQRIGLPLGHTTAPSKRRPKFAHLAAAVVFDAGRALQNSRAAAAQAAHPLDVILDGRLGALSALTGYKGSSWNRVGENDGFRPLLIPPKTSRKGS